MKKWMQCLCAIGVGLPLFIFACSGESSSTKNGSVTDWFFLILNLTGQPIPVQTFDIDNGQELDTFSPMIPVGGEDLLRYESNPDCLNDFATGVMVGPYRVIFSVGDSSINTGGNASEQIFGGEDSNNFDWKDNNGPDGSYQFSLTYFGNQGSSTGLGTTTDRGASIGNNNGNDNDCGWSGNLGSCAYNTTLIVEPTPLWPTQPSP